MCITCWQLGQTGNILFDMVRTSETMAGTSCVVWGRLNQRTPFAFCKISNFTNVPLMQCANRRHAQYTPKTRSPSNNTIYFYLLLFHSRNSCVSSETHSSNAMAHWYDYNTIWHAFETVIIFYCHLRHLKSHFQVMQVVGQMFELKNDSFSLPMPTSRCGFRFLFLQR